MELINEKLKGDPLGSFWQKRKNIRNGCDESKWYFQRSEL